MPHQHELFDPKGADSKAQGGSPGDMKSNYLSCKAQRAVTRLIPNILLIPFDFVLLQKNS